MNWISRATKNEKGFTLVEVMASLVVFTILLIGITPLIASSLQGAALNREFTVAKNITTEAMERIRGLPLFDVAPNRDVLDLYFPGLGTGYSATTKAFTTTCTPTSSTPSPSAALACPPKNSDGTAKIPTGYTMTFVTTFVEVVPGSNPETHAVVTPPTGWTSSAEPPARLLQVVVTTTWLQGGRSKSYQLASFIGDRKLSPVKIRGEGRVDFVAQALTSYEQNDDSPTSALLAIAGRSSSKIELKNFATATQDSRAGKFTLTRQEFDGVSGAIVSDVSAAQSLLSAPPNTSPATRVDAAAVTVASDGLTPSQLIGGATTTSVNESSSPNSGVSVLNQLPTAVGNFSYTAGNGPDHFWVNNQAETGNTSTLKLDPLKKIFSIHRVADKRLRGNTSATSTALAPVTGRKVETLAHAEASKMVLLPTLFATGDAGVVVIDNFVADVSCKSTGNAATSAVTGTWSATLKYWRDTTADNLPNGSYSAPIALSGTLGSTAADPLAAISRSTNPVVYDGLTASDDVYLFDDPALGRKGYLDSWSSKPFIGSSNTAKKSTVDMQFAIEIVTAKTNLNNDQTKLAITIGKLSCNAEDLR